MLPVHERVGARRRLQRRPREFYKADFPALDWTAVRPPNISGGPGKAGSPLDLLVGPVSTCRGDVRRVDLARFMVSGAMLAKDGPWLRQMPAVSNN